MKAHDLAKALLAAPNVPVVINGWGSDHARRTAEDGGEGFSKTPMTRREQIIFERLLCLAANEYGKTREEMLAWVSDDTDPNWTQLDYPEPLSAHLPGAFIQRTRISNFGPPSP